MSPRYRNMEVTTEASVIQPTSNPANYENQEQQDVDEGGSSKRQKSRHRASVACATCRERRIRVSKPALVDQDDSDWFSALYHQVTLNVCNANELERNVSSRTMTSEDDPSHVRI